jgi:N-acylneuraminate cytidylyltransferase
MRLFCGKPLIYWAIHVAKKSSWGRVCVSTESIQIAEYAESLGAEVPFLRPKVLSTDTATTESVLKHFVQGIGVENISRLALLQPTSPFRRVSDILDAESLFNDFGNITSVFSVKQAVANQHPDWMIGLNPRGHVERYNGKSLKDGWGNRQKLMPVYIRNDYVYMLKPQNLSSSDGTLNMYGENPKIMVSAPDRIDIDINNQVDWDVAEVLFEKFSDEFV